MNAGEERDGGEGLQVTAAGQEGRDRLYVAATVWAKHWADIRVESTLKKVAPARACRHCGKTIRPLTTSFVVPMAGPVPGVGHAIPEGPYRGRAIVAVYKVRPASSVTQKRGEIEVWVWFGEYTPSKYFCSQLCGFRWACREARYGK